MLGVERTIPLVGAKVPLGPDRLLVFLRGLLQDMPAELTGDLNVNLEDLFSYNCRSAIALRSHWIATCAATWPKSAVSR